MQARITCPVVGGPLCGATVDVHEVTCADCGRRFWRVYWSPDLAGMLHGQDCRAVHEWLRRQEIARYMFVPIDLRVVWSPRRALHDCTGAQ